MYPYVKYADETEVVFSNIYVENEIECIDVHFERPTEKGFDSVRIQLPTYKVTIWEGNCLIYLNVIGYKIYFWSNENNEPIHIHISKGKLTRKCYKNLVN